MKHIFLLIGLVAVLTFAFQSTHAQQGSAPPEAKQPSKELYHSVNVIFGTPDDAKISLDWITARGKPDLAANLITGMRFTRLPRRHLDKALQTLTGETEAKGWFDWMLWQQQNSQIKPHESLLDLKSTIFYGIDPSFSRFFRPGMEFDIRPEEIVWGGVRVDGIPALDNPTHITPAKATYLLDDDEVFGIEINGDVRAYPLRIMGWHEMFNDVIGGVPISLAYCTLCNAGIAFEGDHFKDNAAGAKKLGLDKPFTFGSSGFLYQSNKLMYDRNTDSLWNQFTGEPVAGPLRGSGIALKIRPVVITSWGEWKKTHPNTKVLSLKTGFRRDYGSGVVYNDYFASPRLMFPALGDQARTLEEKEQIFGLRLEGGVKAWPLEAFKNGRVVNDQVGLVNVVLIGQAGTRTVRAYTRDNLNFTQTPQGTLQDDKGTDWTITEDALTNAQGHQLKRLPGHISYWFAWAGYLGDKSALFEER